MSDVNESALPVAGPSNLKRQRSLSVEDEGFEKPISLEELKKFNKKVDRTGIVYLSRIPPGMGPSQVKHLLSSYGEIGRVYLKRDDRGEDLVTPVNDAPVTKRQKEKHKAHRFAEGWIEFMDKKVARETAELVNACPIGGKKSFRFRDDIWTMKYLPKFKWGMLSEQVGEWLPGAFESDGHAHWCRTAFETSIQTSLLRSHLSQSKRDQANYLEQVERARVNSKVDEKRRKRDERLVEMGQEPKGDKRKERTYPQRAVLEREGPKASDRKSSGPALKEVLQSIF